MKPLEASGAVRQLYGTLGVKGLIKLRAVQNGIMFYSLIGCIV